MQQTNKKLFQRLNIYRISPKYDRLFKKQDVRILKQINIIIFILHM